MPPFLFDAKCYPTTPGCYLMKDAKGRVIYVGKAKDLRKRLSSYFQPHRKEWRVARLVERVRDIEVILVNNEIESLILENNLIKRYQPRFNVSLMSEDQGYPYIVLTNEEFPRFVPYKKHRVNWALKGIEDQPLERRFGPYPSNRFRNTLLDFVNENFLLRQCNPLPKRACLLYHLGKCSAPCEGRINAEDYARAVRRATKFLSHPPVSVVRQMHERMHMHAERLEFERAQRIKEQLKVLERALSLQVVERDVKHDQDVIYFGERTVMVMRVRCGAVSELSLHRFNVEHTEADMYRQFLLARYSSNNNCPHELIVNQMPNARAISAVLNASNGHKVKINVPKQGAARALLKLCQLNHDYRVNVNGHSTQSYTSPACFHPADPERP